MYVDLCTLKQNRVGIARLQKSTFDTFFTVLHSLPDSVNRAKELLRLSKDFRIAISEEVEKILRASNIKDNSALVGVISDLLSQNGLIVSVAQTKVLERDSKVIIVLWTCRLSKARRPWGKPRCRS